MEPNRDLPSLPLRRVNNTVRQLLNDMHTVVEARCRVHGTGGGTTANSAAALLPCIGIEMVASRTARRETKDESLRRVWTELAALTGYDPYRSVGFALYKLCRNGLAHGFYPNEVHLANGPTGGVMVSYWIDSTTQRSLCVDEVEGNSESGHLTLVGPSDRRLIQVFAQHLYRDVRVYLQDFLARLGREPALQSLVEYNDIRASATVTEAATEGLEERDFIALGM